MSVNDTFTVVCDPLGALPISLADSEVQALQVARAFELGRRSRCELETDGHVLGDAVAA